MPRGTFQGPHPRGEPQPTHTSTGGPATLAGSPGSLSRGVTAPPSGSCACKVLFVSSKTGVSVSLSPLGGL